MIGLNHEMGRELLWREYPTDRRGSYFRFFWNRRGAAQQEFDAADSYLESRLGLNPSAAGNPDQLVLLVRGELFRRYPTAVIYAAKATGTVTNPKLTTQERYPLFRGSAPPDVAFFGFDLTAAAARGTDPDPGWFFVIQQQPGEPDFGLDLPKDIDPQPPRVTDWNQLTWRHLVQSAAELRALTHVKVGVSPDRRRRLLPDTSANPPGAEWGANGAHMARITLQKPVRIAILARQMLPRGRAMPEPLLLNGDRPAGPVSGSPGDPLLRPGAAHPRVPGQDSCRHARARADRGRSRVGQTLPHGALERDDGRGAKERVATARGPLRRGARVLDRAPADADESGRAADQAAEVSVAAGAPGRAEERNVDARAAHGRAARSMDRDRVCARYRRSDGGG